MRPTNNFEYREAKKDAWCRCCDGLISKGEYMITGHSHANRGMYMHFHLRCVYRMLTLIPEETLNKLKEMV